MARTQRTEDAQAVEELLTATENQLPYLADVPTPGWAARDHLADLVLPDFVTRAGARPGSPKRVHVVARGAARAPEAWATGCGWRCSRTGKLTTTWAEEGSPCTSCLNLAPDRFRF